MCKLVGWIGGEPQMIYCEEYLKKRRAYDDARDDLNDAKDAFKAAESAYDKMWDEHIPDSKDGIAGLYVPMKRKEAE